MAQADAGTQQRRVGAFRNTIAHYIFDGVFWSARHYSDHINDQLAAIYSDRSGTPDTKKFLCALQVIEPTDDELFNAVTYCMYSASATIEGLDDPNHLVSIKHAKSLSRFIFLFQWLQRREGWKFEYVPDGEIDLSLLGQVQRLQDKYPKNQYVQVMCEIATPIPTVKSANKC